MPTIWTTPVRYSDFRLMYAHRQALGLLAAGILTAGCVFDAGGASTTAVALDTGAEGSTGPGSSTSSGETTTGASEGSGTGAGDSSSGEPPDPDTSSTGTASSEGGEQLCGNGEVDPGEDCDGELVGAESCAELDATYTEGIPTCDGACRLDTSACVACEAPALKPCDDAGDHPLQALELGCDTVKGWSAADSVPLTMKSFNSPDPTAYRVLRRFGSHPSAWSPRAGAKALLIGTGVFDPPDPGGVVTDAPGSAQYGGNNLNPDSADMLPDDLPIKTVDGGSAPFVDCDGVNDCSNTLADQWKLLSPKHAKDIFWFEVETVVPPGTHGYALDLAFFTAHYPEYNGTSYNDMVVLWSQSEAYVGNVSYRRDGDKYGPLSLPELIDAGWMTHDGITDPELANTGYDGDPMKKGSQGGASEWLTIAGPAVPGESLILTLAVMDLEDSAVDSAILVDNFRWSCTGCDLATDCGVRLADAP